MPPRYEQLDASLAALAAGDRSAFEVVYAQAYPAVNRFLMRMMQGDTEAEDVCQTALLKVFERASEYDPGRPAMPWILGIAAWEARTLRKKRRRRRDQGLTPTLLDSLQDPGASPATQAIRSELHDELERIIGELRPIDVETLEAALDRRTPSGVSATTFRKRMQRALERLRAVWGEHHEL